MQRAKEYIDNHWLKEFDATAAARVSNVSRSKLLSSFKQHTGMTMYDYSSTWKNPEKLRFLIQEKIWE